MGKKDMWFLGKLSLGLAIVNSIIMALADSKLTMDEILQIANTIIQGFAEDFKLKIDDVQVFSKDDGTVVILLSKDLVEKFSTEL